jgi:hypothetical protein
MMRSLPIRVEPIPGESLTSWLCALAHRNTVTWQQILTAVGLYRHRGDAKHVRWAARLHPHELDALATATGLEAHAVRDMTLARYDGLGITTGRRPPRKDLGALSGCDNPWRYCPHCLAESGGRWQLRWSLGWTFACETHRCVLVDVCPQCERPPQRPIPMASAIPDLSVCGQPHRDGRRRHRCNTDLSDARRSASPATAEMIDAQHAINAVIDQRATSFGAYRQRSAPVEAVLADLRAIGNQALTYRVYPSPPELFRSHDSYGDPQFRAKATASALTAAVGILDSSDITAAARSWRAMSAGAPPALVRADSIAAAFDNPSTTPTLAALRLAGISERLSPSDQLRYRAFTAHPHRPLRPEATLAQVTRALPSQIWPQWAATLCPAEVGDGTVRAALACAVVLVGTDAPLASIAKLLGIASSASSIWKILQRLQSEGAWSQIALAVTHLADHIARQPTVIDYQRRRQLNYEALLGSPSRQHGAIVADTADLDLVRCVAFERLSGLPIRRAPWFRNHESFASACRRLHDAPDRQQQLDHIGRHYLAEQRIDEPVIAAPPLTLVAGLY